MPTLTSLGGRGNALSPAAGTPAAGLAAIDPVWVTLTTAELVKDDHLTVTAKLADGSPQVVGGGGWETVPRPGRRALTVWRGTDAPQMTLPLVLDGWRPNTLLKAALDGTSVEPDVRTIEKMAGALVAGDVRPEPLIVSGVAVPHAAERASKNRWVIAEPPDWGEALRRRSDGDRVRQFVVLTLWLHTEPEGLERVEPRQPKPKYKVVKAQRGDTFAKIAKRRLKDTRLGGRLAKLNAQHNPKRFKNAGANTRIAEGIEVRLPTAHLLNEWKRDQRNGSR